MDALPIIFTGIATFVGVLHFVLAYTQKEEEHRRRFNQLAFGWAARLAPVAKLFGIRLLFLVLTIGTALIVWRSVCALDAFLVSTEPVTRPEIFQLLVNSFNAFCYAVGCIVCLSFTLHRHRSPVVQSCSGHLMLGRKEGETIKLTLDADSVGDSSEGLAPCEITITVSEIRSGQVKLGIEAPKSVKILRGELQSSGDELCPVVSRV